jgi:hypothetical protein
VNKSILAAATLWVMGSVGLAYAADTQVPLEAGNVSADVTALEDNHPMIFELRDRIQNQRERINRGVIDGSITKEVATSFLGVLDQVREKMKADYKTNGAEKSMKLRRDQYMALNGMLDSNSKILHEMKQVFYYYDPYFDNAYGEYQGAELPNARVSELEENHPMIFELKDRIQNQRDRIDEGLYTNTLSAKQALESLDVLKSVEKKMKADYKANGSSNKKMRLTKEQYVAFNHTLDSNSVVIHEGKQFFYYYGPYYDQYWF